MPDPIEIHSAVLKMETEWTDEHDLLYVHLLCIKSA